MKIPAWLTIAIFSVGLVALASYLVWYTTYSSAMRELKHHEEIDLREEAKLRCQDIRHQINVLKSDTVQLANDMIVRKVMSEVHKQKADDVQDVDAILDSELLNSEQSNRMYLREKLINLSRLDFESDKVLEDKAWKENPNSPGMFSREGDSISVYKPYFQMRLIDAKGLEIYRIEMKYKVARGFSDENIMIWESTKREDKSPSDYFQTAKKLQALFDRNEDRASLIRPYLTRFELNKENDEFQEERPTIRCWVPVFSDSGEEFLGIAIINFDFKTVRQSNKQSPRHLVYLTNEEGEFLIHPDDEKEFQFNRGNPNPETILTTKELGQRTNLNQRIETTVAETFGQSYIDQELNAKESNSPKKERSLEFSGWRVAGLENNPIKFEKPLKGESDESDYFTLVKFRKDDANWDLGTWLRFTAAMTDILLDESYHADSLPRFHTNAPMSASMNNSFHVSAKISKEEIKGEIRKMLEEHAVRKTVSSPAGQRKLSEIFEQAIVYEPIECRSFAAYFFRVYLDPGTDHLIQLAEDSDIPFQKKPTDYYDKYAGFLMGFSNEELEADLQQIRRNAIYSTLGLGAICSILAVAFALIFTRKLKKLTTAAEKIADGKRDVDLPNVGLWHNEVDDLVVAFDRMSDEIKKREFELESDRANLHREVQKRTQDLTDKILQLNAAKAELEGLSEAKDVFLASVSHELRNPLNAVMGFCQLLEMSELDEQQSEDVHKIGTNAKLLLSLINDILDYQKIIMGGITIESEVFNLDVFMVEVEDGLKHLADLNQNRLIVERIDSAKTIYADRRRLLQVLTNIAGNACKFTRNGTVEVAAKQIHRDVGNWWEFVVRDDGPGMDDAVKEKLYTPFQRARVSQGGGTGLGLVICKGFVELMEGTISFESELGTGTQFTILLPATEHDRSLAVKTRHKEKTRIAMDQIHDSPGSGRFSRNSKVLVIEDEEEFLELIRRTVEPDGWTVVEASNGFEALEILDEIRPAAIILDLFMPKMDGFEFLSNYIDKAKKDKIPIIVMTGVETTNDNEKFLNESVVRILRKDRFSPEELLTELKYQVAESAIAGEGQ